MKPTWDGWAEVYDAQHVDVSSTEECLYAGRWTEHDDIMWSDWQYSSDDPLTWDHCALVQEMDVDMTMQLWHTAGATELWHDVHPQTQDTLWIPVEYPN